MRKVILRMKEQRKYEVIKKLVETNGNKKRAAVELDLSLRQINRLIAGYITYGKEFFIHGNRNKIPQNKISYELKQKIVELYETKYFDCNFTFFKELLLEHENINLKGKNFVIVNRSMVIAKPLAMMALAHDATVTICHSNTKNLKELTKAADIVCVATGRAKFFDKEYFNEENI